MLKLKTIKLPDGTIWDFPKEAEGIPAPIPIQEWMMLDMYKNHDLDKQPDIMLNNQKRIVWDGSNVGVSGSLDELSLASGLSTWTDLSDLFTHYYFDHDYILTGFYMYYKQVVNGANLGFSDPHVEILGGRKYGELRNISGFISPSGATYETQITLPSPVMIRHLRIKYAGNSSFNGRNYRPLVFVPIGYPTDGRHPNHPEAKRPNRRTWIDYIGCNVIRQSTVRVQSDFSPFKNKRAFAYDYQNFVGEETRKTESGSFTNQGIHGGNYKPADKKQSDATFYPKTRDLGFNPAKGGGGFNFDQFNSDCSVDGAVIPVVARHAYKTNVDNVAAAFGFSNDNGGNLRVVLNNSPYGNIAGVFQPGLPIDLWIYGSGFRKVSTTVLSADYSSGTRITLNLSYADYGNIPGAIRCNPELSVVSANDNGGEARLVLDSVYGNVTALFAVGRDLRVDTGSFADGVRPSAVDFSGGSTRVTINRPFAGTETGVIHPLPDPYIFYQPVDDGGYLDDPFSWREYSSFLYQITARYGNVSSMDDSLVFVDSNNVILKGQGTLPEGVELCNESNRTWVTSAHQMFTYLSPKSMAAKISAGIDGHCGLLGPGHGLRNADPNIPFNTGGLSEMAWAYWVVVQWELIELRRPVYRGTGYPLNPLLNCTLSLHGYPNENGNQRAGGICTFPEDPAIKLRKAARAAAEMVPCFFDSTVSWTKNETGYDKVIPGQATPNSKVATPYIDGVDTRDEVSTNYDASQESAAKMQLRNSLCDWVDGIPRQYVWNMYDETPQGGTAWDDTFKSSGLVGFNGANKWMGWYVYMTMRNRLEGWSYVNHQEVENGRFILELTNGVNSAYIVWHETNSDLSEVGILLDAKGYNNCIQVTFTNLDENGVEAPVSIVSDQISVDAVEWPKIYILSTV